VVIASRRDKMAALGASVTGIRSRTAAVFRIVERTAGFWNQPRFAVRDLLMSARLAIYTAVASALPLLTSAVVLAQSNPAAPDVAEVATTDEAGFFSSFIDPFDGRFDFTAGGADGGTAGIVPLGIPGNDPTMGPNLLLAAVYFHAPDPDAEPVAGSPPTMTFGGVGFAENESWALGGGHSAVWADGRIRYAGGLATASINLDYYGPDAGSGSDTSPLAFNIDGAVLMQQAQIRLGSSNFFLGGRYTFLATEVTFDIQQGEALSLGSSDDSGITAFLSYDTRDNTFTPNQGTRASVGVSSFTDSLGGDYTYRKFDVSGIQYWRLFDERMSLGLRAEYHYTEDDAPFYALPWVSLRGIPALRYQGSHAVTVEIEPRWKIDERWSVLGFTGIGRASSHFDELSDAVAAYNYGVGFRYLLARRLGLAAGIDIARGPEETVVYITFGNAWGL
jgi:hypothetical protein